MICISTTLLVSDVCLTSCLDSQGVSAVLFVSVTTYLEGSFVFVSVFFDFLLGLVAMERGVKINK